MEQFPPLVLPAMMVAPMVTGQVEKIAPPPPPLDELPEKVLLLTASVPAVPKVSIAPPPLVLEVVVAELLVNVLVWMLAVVPASTPIAPPLRAEFPENVLLVTVRVR